MTAIFLLAHQLEKNTSPVQIMELLSQLLMYVRSSCAIDHFEHHSNIKEDSESVASFVQRPTSLNPSITSSVTINQLNQSLVAMNDEHCDDILACCIRTIKQVMDSMKHYPMESTVMMGTKLSELSELLIKLLSDDNLRIESYLYAGKLKLAYLMAVSLGQCSSVFRVLEAARLSNDQHYVKICEMWLKKNGFSP